MTQFAELFVRVTGGLLISILVLFFFVKVRWRDRWLRSCAVLICENDAGGSISDLVRAVVVT